MSDRAEKTPRKQQKRSLRTKQKLLDAALDAFSEGGFAGTSTRDIAARAGVHHPLITYHFSNKDRLWRSAVKYVFVDFIDALKAAQVEHTNSCPKARFAAMIKIYIRWAAEQPSLHKIILQESGSPSSRLEWLVENYLSPLSEIASRYIAELQDQGVVQSGNPAMIFNMIRVSSGGLIAHALELKRTSNIDFSNKETLEELTDLVIRTFLPGEVQTATA